MITQTTDNIKHNTVIDKYGADPGELANGIGSPEEHERTRPARIFEVGLPWKMACQLHEIHLELVGGDPRARLHPEIFKLLPPILEYWPWAGATATARLKNEKSN